MKPHYHHDVVGAIIGTLEFVLIIHGFRFLAGHFAGSSNTLVSKTATAVGGAFTFGGHP